MVDVMRNSGSSYLPTADMVSTGGEGLVSRMQARFSEHHHHGVTPLFRRLIAPVEKIAKIRQKNSIIDVQIKKFDSELTSRESESRKSEGKRVEAARGNENERAQKSDMVLALTLEKLKSTLGPSQVCHQAWEAIVRRKDGENSWPSIVAMVTDQSCEYESALFVLAAVERTDEPLRIRMIIPISVKSTVYMRGSGCLGVRTTRKGDKDTFHIFLSSVQSLWTALSCINDLLETADRAPTTDESSWLGKFYDMEEEDLEWDSMVSLSSSLSSSTDSIKHLLEDNHDQETKREIVAALREILMVSDLESITCSRVYQSLAAKFGRDLKPDYKRFIDEKMIMVMGQMETSSEIFDDFLYLGSEWNASNMDELEENDIDCILNVTKEIPAVHMDNVIYYRVPVADVETEDLLSWLPDAVEFIIQAEKRGSKCLVHCQRGISRSASTVVAYAMKSRGWTLEQSLEHVKAKRNIVKPNKGFMNQLRKYEDFLRDMNYIRNS